MIETIINNNNNIAKYKEMDNNKVKCSKCGSIVLKSSFTRHEKTLKHIGGGNLVIKSSDRHVAMRNTTQGIRAKHISENGIEAVREKERLKKQAQRAKLKAGKEASKEARQVPVSENKHDVAIDEFKSAQKDVDQIKDKSQRLKISEVVREARSQVADGKKTLPQAKSMIKDKIKKVMIQSGKKEECNQVASTLDNRNLKYPDGIPVERKTLEGYLKKIGNIYKRMEGTDWHCSDFDWLNNTQKVISFLENDDRSAGTKQNNLNAIYSILRRIEGYDSIVNTYKEALGKWTNIVKHDRGTNLLTDREQVSFMPWSKIVKFNDKTWTEEASLLFKLYTAIPPRRGKDYSHMKYIKGKSVPAVKKMDPFYNYMVVNSNGNPIALVISNYKTKKIYGQYTVDLTLGDMKPHFRFSEIRKAIKEFAKATDIKSNELVFPNTLGGIYQQFSPYINFLFKSTGLKISVNLLRHSFATSFMANNNLSDNTIKKMAVASGNSLDQFRNYRRIDAPVDDDESD